MTLKLVQRLALSAGLVSSFLAAAPPGVSLVGKGSIPGDALDSSGLKGEICQTHGI